MKIPADWAAGTVRFSIGRSTTEEEVTSAANHVARTVLRILSSHKKDDGGATKLVQSVVVNEGSEKIKLVQLAHAAVVGELRVLGMEELEVFDNFPALSSGGGGGDGGAVLCDVWF